MDDGKPMIGGEKSIADRSEEPTVPGTPSGPGAVDPSTLFLPVPARKSAAAVDTDAPTLGSEPGIDGFRDRPETIGPYRVLSILGEGGMGCVYLAEQDEPVKRQVAIKLIRASLTSPLALSRFMAERQAMARLSHPAIAQMFEAGTTDDGFPYFVMEHVPGEPLTTYCDRHHLSTSERIELFIRICQGVEHAHRKGILHRDLKPSNVLVAEVDGEAAPKIIDFGIAKAVDQPLTDETLLTRFGIGTPTYMSPEAFATTPGGGIDVDTRTDVYALGVMLYVLLVGSPPFDVRGSSMGEVLRVITEVDPERPSKRVAALAADQQEQVAESRGTDRRQLVRQLRGDLDWIVAKAMAKDRDRRYGSATELAADLRAHLDLHPVTAGPPSLPYRASRFVRRHLAAVVGTAIAVLALVLGILGTTYGMLRANREAERANRETEKTHQALLDAEGVTDFLVDLFEVSDPREAGGETVTAREILDRGAARIEEQLADQPLRRARLMHTMGTIYNQLQDHQEAKRLVKTAVDLRRELLTPEHLDVGESLYRLAVISRELADYETAEEAARKALEIRRAAYGPDHLHVGEIERELGVILFHAGRVDEAETYLRRALKIAEQEADADFRAAALEAWGNLLKARGRCAEAVPYLQQSLELREARLGPKDPRLAYSLNNLGSCLGEAQRYEEARDLFERALAIQERTLGPQAKAVAAGRANLGIIYRELGENAKAEASFVAARESFVESLGAEHPFAANPLAELGVLLWQTGRLDEAEESLREALRIWQKNPGPDHLLTAWAHGGLANVLRDSARPEEAERHYLRSLAVREAQLPTEHPELQQVLRDYHQLLEDTGRHVEARALEAKLVPSTESR